MDTNVTAEGLHPELQMSIKEQDSLFKSWKAELSLPKRAFYWFGRVICLNILVEDLVDGAEESIKRLESVYNLIGLIAALLLSMGIGPFQDFPRWVREGSFAWGLSPFQVVCQQLSAYALLAMMASCLGNLLLITGLYVYLNAVHDKRVRLEVLKLPVFGLPLLILCLDPHSLFSVLAAIVYAICYVAVTVDWQFAVFSMAMAGTVTCVGLPLMSYLFFCRLRSLKRSHAHHKQ